MSPSTGPGLSASVRFAALEDVVEARGVRLVRGRRPVALPHPGVDEQHPSTHLRQRDGQVGPQPHRGLTRGHPGDHHLGDGVVAGLHLEGDPHVPEHVRRGGARVERGQGRRISRRGDVRQQRSRGGLLRGARVVDGVAPPVAEHGSHRGQHHGEEQPRPRGDQQVGAGVGHGRLCRLAGRELERPTGIEERQHLGHRVGDQRGDLGVLVVGGDLDQDRPAHPFGVDRAPQLLDVAVDAALRDDRLDDLAGVRQLGERPAQRVQVFGE